LLKLRGPERVLATAFSPDGRRIVTISADKTVKVWEAASEATAATDASSALAAPSFAPTSVPSGRGG
jgi:WD40 repeat protein